MNKQICRMHRYGTLSGPMVGEISRTEAVFEFAVLSHYYGALLDHGYALACFDTSYDDRDVWRAERYISYGDHSVWTPKERKIATCIDELFDFAAEGIPALSNCDFDDAELDWDL